MVNKFILGEFLKKKWGRYVLGIAALIVTSLLQITIPKLLGYITDLMKDLSVDWRRISWLVGGLLVISVVVFCTKYLWRNCLIGSSRDLECFLRAKLFAHLQSLPVSFYNNRKTGDLMAYAINDLNAVKRAFAFGLVVLIDGVVINLGSIIIMARTIHPVLTAAALIPIIAASGIMLKMRGEMRERFTGVQEAFADVSGKVQENISGIRVVKGYVQEEYEIDKIKEASRHRIEAQMKYIRLSALLMPVVQICFGTSFMLGLILGGKYVTGGEISLGDFVAFNTYLTMLHGPVMRIGRIVEVWQQALASIKRLDNIFEMKTNILDVKTVFPDKRFRGDIKIKKLSFSYPGSSNHALKNINIDLKAGKTLAIMGETGSGKTTLLNLLLRLYRVGRGQIFIDGVDISDIPLAVLRENIGYVPQDNFLFSASISDNIKFFRNIYNDNEVEEATRLSSVYENIIDFPEGFDTLVGERGVTLSGGQKQRISIARAIIKDPSILILDDSLSAVDTKTEEEILSNLKEVLNGRTGIIIAHRISTIKHADEIVILDKGRIVERGTHEQLMSRKGRYYRLYYSQLADSSTKGKAGSVV